MPRLVGSILTEDGAFRTQVAALLRAGTMPVSLGGDPLDDASGDIAIVDARCDAAAAMTTVERVRLAAPAVAIFVVADEAPPELILHAMRAGANEFLTWPPADTAFSEAVARAAARRQSSAGSRQARR